MYYALHKHWLVQIEIDVIIQTHLFTFAHIYADRNEEVRAAVSVSVSISIFFIAISLPSAPPVKNAISYLVDASLLLAQHSRVRVREIHETEKSIIARSISKRRSQSDRLGKNRLDFVRLNKKSIGFHQFKKFEWIKSISIIRLIFIESKESR